LYSNAITNCMNWTKNPTTELQQFVTGVFVSSPLVKNLFSAIWNHVIFYGLQLVYHVFLQRILFLLFHPTCASLERAYIQWRVFYKIKVQSGT